MKKVSIIVPVYNSARTIKKCIDSVVNQSYNDWQLILINDGSTDDTKKIIESYNDVRIKLVNQDNEGVSASRNRGILEADGEYIIFLDSDDSLTVNACETFVEGMKNSDYCISGYRFTGDLNFYRNFNDIPVNEGIYSINDFENIFPYLYAVGYINAPWAKCFKKELIKTLFDTNISIGEDLLFNLAYLNNCRVICLISKPTYNYTFKSELSLSGRISMKYEMQIKMYNQCRELICTNFENFGRGVYITNQRYLISMFSMIYYDIRNRKIDSYPVFLKIVEKCQLLIYSRMVKLSRMDKKWETIRRFAEGGHFLIIYILLKIRSFF